MKFQAISDGTTKLAVLASSDSMIVGLDLRTGKVSIEDVQYVPSNFHEIGEIDLPPFLGTVYLDVDDILLDFHGYLNAFVGRTYDLILSHDFKPSEYDYSDVLKGHGDGTLTIGKIFTDMGITWPKELHAIHNASLFTKALKALGARIVLVTSVSLEQLPVRIANLARNGVLFDELYPSKGIKKSSIINAFKYRATQDDIFVDDMLSNCYEVGANSVGLSIITLKTPYNETFAKTNGANAYSALDSKIESFGFVQEIYTATLEHVAAAVLRDKGLQNVQESEPVKLSFEQVKPAYGCGSDNACASCPSRKSGTTG